MCNPDPANHIKGESACHDGVDADHVLHRRAVCVGSQSGLCPETRRDGCNLGQACREMPYGKSRAREVLEFWPLALRGQGLREGTEIK